MSGGMQNLKGERTERKTIRLITRVNYNRVVCLWAGIEVAILLESANRHTCNDWYCTSRLLLINVRHTVFFLPWQTTVNSASITMLYGPRQHIWYIIT